MFAKMKPQMCIENPHLGAITYYNQDQHSQLSLTYEYLGIWTHMMYNVISEC